jgi:hypothetical protein
MMEGKMLRDLHRDFYYLYLKYIRGYTTMDLTNITKIIIEKDGPGYEVRFIAPKHPYGYRLFKYSKWDYVLEKLRVSPLTK